MIGLTTACAHPASVPGPGYVQALPEVDAPRAADAPPVTADDAGAPAESTQGPRRAVDPSSRGPRPAPPTRHTSTAAEGATPQQVVADATHRAVQSPSASDTFNAIVQYAYEIGTLYQVYAAPMRVTDIVLQPGEKILGSPAAGDVVRWILALGQSMDHGVAQTHVYLKPTRPELTTNLAINTDRRTYLLELHSYPETYMAAVMWHYPQDEMARLELQGEVTRAQRSTQPLVSLEALNFNYAIEVVHGTPAWTPTQVFDDGRRTFIRFPAAMLAREAPALFVLRDSQTQIVNYRQKGDYYVVDRLIDAAEMRVGQKDPEIVRIRRAEPKH